MLLVPILVSLIVYYQYKGDDRLWYLTGTLYIPQWNHYHSARSKFWGVSGSEDRSGGDNSIQFLNIGRVGDKRGGGMEWYILTFYATGSTKTATLHFRQFFLFVFVKFRNS